MASVWYLTMQDKGLISHKTEICMNFCRVVSVSPPLQNKIMQLLGNCIHKHMLVIVCMFVFKLCLTLKMFEKEEC